MENANSKPSAVVLGLVGEVNLARIGSLLGLEANKISEKSSYHAIDYRIEMSVEQGIDDALYRLEASYEYEHASNGEPLDRLRWILDDELEEIYESQDWEA